MRLLSIDQSSRVSGWSFFDGEKLVEYGKIDLQGDIDDRLVQFRKEVLELINKYKPTDIAFEDIQLQKEVNGVKSMNNIQTFKILAMIFGVLLEITKENKTISHIIPSSVWKSTLKIKGRLRNEQKKNAQEYVVNTYNLKVIQDIVDSICIADHVRLEEKKVTSW